MSNTVVNQVATTTLAIANLYNRDVVMVMSTEFPSDRVGLSSLSTRGDER